MLDPWIIEEILRRERQREERPQVQIELDDTPPRPPIARPEEPQRGVTIIDI